MDEDTRNSNDIALELARLHILRGIEFTRQLRQITQRKEFRLVKDETEIFSAIGEYDDDFPALLNAAQKAVSHGYRVYILPNPKGIRTADFIFERKGVYRMYDLKTIQGRLLFSIDLSNPLARQTMSYSIWLPTTMPVCWLSKFKSISNGILMLVKY